MNVKGLRSRLASAARAMPGPDPLAVLREHQAASGRLRAEVNAAIEEAERNPQPAKPPVAPVSEERLRALETADHPILRTLARRIREERIAT